MSRILTFSLLVFQTSFADVSPNKLIADNAVLQCCMDIPIWGTAFPGENVTVEFNGQIKRTKTLNNGQWSITLSSMNPGGPFKMNISGENQISLNNIMVGEVWVCAGQSNMEVPLQEHYDYKKETENLSNMRVNHFIGDRNWQVVSANTARQFSAVGFFFGREIHRTQDVAVGLIQSAISGSRVESWMTPDKIQEDPDLNMGDSIKAWKGSLASEFYQLHIKPIVPYGVRGTIWYQGEANTTDAADMNKYGVRFKALIEGWRSAWSQDDFHFIYVQLPNFAGGSPKGWPQVREFQRQALVLPQTGMISTLDIGEANNIHPANKLDVGKRLAAQALFKIHNVVKPYSGPMYHYMQVKGDKLVLFFTNVESGLESRGGPLREFEITGADSQWVTANAFIEGEQIALSHPNVTKPVAARYAWKPNPSASLFNKEGFPAVSFRTHGESPSVTLQGKWRSFYEGSGVINSYNILGKNVHNNTSQILFYNMKISAPSN